MVGLHHVRDLLEDDELIIVDGTRGVIIVPTRRSSRNTACAAANSRSSAPSSTACATPAPPLDGEEVNLLANIEGPKDLPAVKSANADGIGLYRTEFLFIGRDTLPDEEEQYEAYRAVVRPCPANRSPSALSTSAPTRRSTVPRRARNQPGARPARGALLAGRAQDVQDPAARCCAPRPHGRLQIMVPMLAHAQEVDQCLTLLEKAKAELRAENPSSTRASASAA